MEDEDDVVKPVDLPPALDQLSSDPPPSEPPQIPDQCGTASTVGDSPPAVTPDNEDNTSPVAEGLAGEGEVVGEVERLGGERENEGENAGKQDAAGEEHGNLAQEGSEEQAAADEIVKEEDLPPVTEDMDAKNVEMGGEGEEAAGEGIEVAERSIEVEEDKHVEAEELPPVTEKVEVAATEDMAGEIAGGDQGLGEDGQGQEVVKQEEEESKDVEGDVKGPEEDESKDADGDVKGQEVAKKEEVESQSVEGDVKGQEVAKEGVESQGVEGDVKGQVIVNEEEGGSKGDEEDPGEKAVDKQEMEVDGEGLLVGKQEDDGLKGVGGDDETQVMVNQEEDEAKGDEGMAGEKEPKADEEMTEEKVEDNQEVGGDAEGRLVAEEKEDESKEVEGDIEGQVELNQEEDESKGDEEMDGEGEAEEMDYAQVNGIESSSVVMKDDELTGEDGTPTADTEMEIEAETVKSGSGGKRRRGRNAKAAPARTPVRKTAGEDVCFICLDGGALVLCDRRGCPKAYHPSCVDHDEEFFKTKDRWTCGWHLCNKCGKNAYFMCYTCTFSLCKGCCKDAVVFYVRGNRGFCESCMKTVMMIENSEQSEGQVAFDDKSSWEYLFKDYWIEQKRRFSITSDELAQAKNPWKSSNATDKLQTIGDVHKGNDDLGTDSDNSSENLEVTDSKRKKGKRKSKSIDSDTDSTSEKDMSTAKRKSKRRLKSQTKEAYSDSEHSSGNEDASDKRGKRPRRLSKFRSKDGSTASAANVEISAEATVQWASKELLEFVMHMKDGDKSVLTQFDVQGLLLEYIKRNKLRDPRRRSQIICDPMLQKLFGKPRVGHFEMLKLLELHFLLKEEAQADDNHGNVVDEMSQPDAADNTDSTLDVSKSKGRKSRRRGEDRGLPSNLDDYAAIDMHNINLIYLRRNLMEALMEDSETFHDKVVGSFVRIRISGSTQKQDIYRLVQIIGTSKAAESYRVGKRTTDVMLEILNLDKTEIISIDTISNQEFTEDECKRLRQSIKCGLISRMTVGDVLEKARELQEVRVTDWLEAEIVRLSHLRDRASEKGRKKELRECVEKLQLLKTPEERQRRLEEIPEVHADPKMDPSCESDDENEMDNRRKGSMRPRESGLFRRDRDHFSSRKGGSVSNDSWSANARPPNKNWELNRNLSGKGFSSRKEDTAAASQTNEHTWNNGVDKGTSGSWEKPRLASNPSMSTRAEYSAAANASASEASQPVSAGTLHTDAKVNETEKMWHYRDPTGKAQGPFSLAQLRKWSNTGYFPADLRIWKTSQGEDDSILLTDALAGRFQKELPSVGLLSDMSPKAINAPSLLESSKSSGHARGSEYGIRYDSSSLPSPTPAQSTAGWGGKQTAESNWSTSSPFRPSNQFQGGGERLPSPTPTSPSSVPGGVERSSFSQQPKDSGVAGNKEENLTASVMMPASVTNSPGQFFSTAIPRPAVSLNSGGINAQQIPSQSAGHMANQAFAPAEAGMSQANLRSDAKIAAQGLSNVVQPGAVQNPSVYTQGWAPGNVARPDIVNANMIPSNSNAVAAQVPYGQWTGAPVANQASSYGAGYPPGPGNMASNFSAMPSHNAWRPTPATMPWGGQPQQPMNPNMGWAESPSAAAFPPPTGAIGQLAGPTPGASAMPSGNTFTGWQGTGPSPTAANTNPGWVAPSGNVNAWGGDHNRRGAGGGGQWNRQSSFGSGGGGGPGTPRGQGVCKFHENGHCKKGAACNYMHT